MFKFNEKAKSLGQSWSFDAALLSIIGQDAQTTWNQYANFINGGGVLDYDGNYPWELDCPENFLVQSTSARNSTSDNEEEIGLSKSAFNIWPNPTTSELNVHFGGEATGVVKIYQTAGILVDEIPIEKTRSVSFSVDHLKPGIYILGVESDIVMRKEKIIIE